MNYLNLLLSTAVVATLACGCSKNAPEKPVQTNVADIGALSKTPAGPVTFKSKWAPGMSYEQQLSVGQALFLAATGTNQPMEQDYLRLQNYAVTVLNTLPDGGHDLQIKFGDLQLQQAQAQKLVISFDSNSQPTAEDNAVVKAFRKIKGAQVNARIDANGKLVSISGLEDQLTALAAGDEKARGIVKTLVNEESLRQVVNHAEDLPDHPVKVGEQWHGSSEVAGSSAGILVVNLNCTFAGWQERNGHHCAVIQYTGDFKSKADPAKGAVAVAVTGGKLTGTTWFDSEAGVVVDTVSDQTASLEINSTTPPTTARMTQKNGIKLLTWTPVKK